MYFTHTQSSQAQKAAGQAPNGDLGSVSFGEQICGAASLHRV